MKRRLGTFFARIGALVQRFLGRLWGRSAPAGLIRSPTLLTAEPPQLTAPVGREARPVVDAELEPVVELVTEPEPEPVVAAEPEPEPVVAVAPEPELEPEPVVAVAPEPELEPEPVVAVAPEPEPEPEPVVAVAPEPEPEPVVSVAPEPEPEPVVSVAPEPEPESEPELVAGAEVVDISTAKAARERDTVPAPARPVEPDSSQPSIEIPRDYVPIAESSHALYQLSLDGFDGPLDLLLFLIRRHKIDILDIPIAFICAEYLRCLQVIKELNVDIAAEFMLMAADLLHIKSKMLLPKPAEIEEEDDVDPRADLVRRLLEYEKYKHAAEQLGALDRLDRDVFERQAEALPTLGGEAPLREVGVFALIAAFDAVVKRNKPELHHHIQLDRVSLRRRIDLLIEHLATKGPVRFDELLGEARQRIDIVMTLLAILELAKVGVLRIMQSEEGTIYLTPRFKEREEALGRVGPLEESYAG